MNRKKYLGFLLSIMLLLTAAVGGTLAFVTVKTLSVKNQFESAYVTCKVVVGEDNNADAIKVQNTSNVDAYIRAAIVVNWMDSDGNVRGIAPTDSEYTLGINTTSWKRDSATGFYYYINSENKKLPPNGTTYNLINSIMVTTQTPPSGYTLSIEVIAEAIQADGVTDVDGTPAYQDAWGIDILGNSGN